MQLRHYSYPFPEPFELKDGTKLIPPFHAREDFDREVMEKWAFTPIFSENLKLFVKDIGKQVGDLFAVALAETGGGQGDYFLYDSQEDMFFLRKTGYTQFRGGVRNEALYCIWRLPKNKIGKRCPIKFDARWGWGGGNRILITYERYSICWDGDLQAQNVGLVYRDSFEEVVGPKNHFGGVDY